MPVPRWESLVPSLVQLQAPKVLLLTWTQNVDLRMQVEMFELFCGDARVSQVGDGLCPTTKPQCYELIGPGLCQLDPDMPWNVIADPPCHEKWGAQHRSYSKAFGRKIYELWREECKAEQPRLCMRQKVHIDPGMTDKGLFESLPLGDSWPDAEMIEVWAYLYKNKKLMIPSSWQSTMDAFNSELLDS
ncbi:unnamed protein product, partial [Symbiodinium sp. CCMP2456]